MASKRAGCRSLEGLSEGRSDHRAEMRGAEIHPSIEDGK